MAIPKFYCDAASDSGNCGKTANYTVQTKYGTDYLCTVHAKKAEKHGLMLVKIEVKKNVA
jgi:hypothetical protein